MRLRGQMSVKYLIDIGVRCQLADRETATIDSALEILEQIADYHFDFGLSNGLAEWMAARSPLLARLEAARGSASTARRSTASMSSRPCDR